MPKTGFQTANHVHSTRSLVKIHNTIGIQNSNLIVIFFLTRQDYVSLKKFSLKVLAFDRLTVA